MRFWFLALFALLLVGTSRESYGQLRNLSVTSYDVVSYNIFTDQLTLKLTVRNDSTGFTLKSFSGLVYQNRHPLVRITAANLFIPKDVSTIGVVCNISRCHGVTVFRLAQCFLPFDIREYTIDVAVAVQYPLAPIEYKEQKNISLSTRV